MDSLVSTDWLANHLGDPDVAIVDCSWFMPNVVVSATSAASRPRAINKRPIRGSL